MARRNSGSARTKTPNSAALPRKRLSTTFGASLHSVQDLANRDVVGELGGQVHEQRQWRRPVMTPLNPADEPCAARVNRIQRPGEGTRLAARRSGPDEELVRFDRVEDQPCRRAERKRITHGNLLQFRQNAVSAANALGLPRFSIVSLP